METRESNLDDGQRDAASSRFVPLDFAGPLPKPTGDLEAAKTDLERAGYAIIAGVLSSDEVHTARTALANAIEREAAIDEALVSGGIFDPDSRNRRLSRLPNRDPLFLSFLEHPIVLEMTRYILGPTLLNESYLVQSYDANVTRPGSGAQALHLDGSTGIRGQARAFQSRFIWCLDEFAEENGATRVVPGSHLWNDRVDGTGATDYESLPAEAPAGSLIVYSDMLLHGTGANISVERERASLNVGYCLPWHRPIVNFPLVLHPEVMEGASETLRQLLGYTEVAINFREPWDSARPEVRALCVPPTMRY